MATIYILWLRQIKRYLRSKPRIIGSLAQPLLFLLSLGYGLGSVFSRAGEGNYINFLAPGIIGMSIIFMAIFNGIEIIWDRQFGFLKETLVAPVSRFNIMLGRSLGGATVATIQGTVVYLISLLAGFKPLSYWAIFPTLFMMFLVAFLFTSLGSLIAIHLSDMQGFQLIMNFLVMPLFFLSGALFPLRDLPKALSVVVKLNPLSYGIDSFRALLTGTSHYGLATDFVVLFSVSVIFVLIGGYFFSRAEV